MSADKTEQVFLEALKYANAGYKVLPLSGKRPITPNGKTDATTNALVIDAWWKGSPMSGVGIVIPDHMVVVDLDSAEALRALDAFGYTLPTTAMAKTKRGYHYWYKRAGELPASRRINILPGVDLLVNGYVVAPPTDGRKWETSILPDENIADAPQWLETLITISNQEYAKVNADEILAGLPEGQRNHGLFRYACSLRARDKTSIQEAKVLLREAARQSEGGSEEFPPAWTDALVDRVWKTYKQREKDEDAVQNIKPKSLAEWAAEPLTPSVQLVEKLIPGYGYTLVSSPPKSGKSALLQYIAACIATGQKVFDQYEVKQSGVLYLDMEQDPYAGFERWKTILQEMKITGFPANLYVEYEWPNMDDGAIEKMKEFLIDHPNVNLIVLDTLADFWPEEDKGGGNAYHREQRVVKQFVPLSRDYGCALVVITHDTKTGYSNLVARANGTYALSGKAAAIWNVQRNPDETNGILETTGKNIPSSTIGISYDKDRTFWTLRFVK